MARHSKMVEKVWYTCDFCGKIPNPPCGMPSELVECPKCDSHVCDCCAKSWDYLEENKDDVYDIATTSGPKIICPKH